MHAGVRGQFRVECCYQMTALFNQNRIFLIAQQNLRFSADAPDDRCADEHSFQFSSASPLCEFRLRIERGDAAIQLAPVPIALDANIHER